MQPTHSTLSEAIGDDGLFTETSRGVDHQLWFVESHVAPK